MGAHTLHSRILAHLPRFSDCVFSPHSPPLPLHHPLAYEDETYLGGVGLALDVLAHGIDDADALATARGGRLPDLHVGGHATRHGEEGMDGGQGHKEGAGDGDLEHG